VVVDFHSHTSFSRDGRWGFTVERNREWHRAGGWHVAYVTDHIDGVKKENLGTLTANPRRAGDGTVLLPGVERRCDGRHFLILGVRHRDCWMLGAEPRNRPATLPFDREHAVIQTTPVKLHRVTAPESTAIRGLVGIELSDGSPHGLDQMQRDHDKLLAIADGSNLAVVAGSNNHGWTYAPLAWNLLRIPGWRDLTPEALGGAIEERLQRERRHAVTVVERYTAHPGSTPVGLVATVPAVAWHMLAPLTPAERASWIGWVWVVAGLSVGGRRSLRRFTGSSWG
jgi:hypothetical protein